MTNKTKALQSESNKNFFISKLYQKKLTDSNRFVCYKADKKPYNAETKKLAKVTNPNDYRSFDLAYNSVKTTQNFKGIGFVLGYEIASGYVYCGIDIDGCIDDNGNISKEAREIIAELEHKIKTLQNQKP